MYLNIEDKASYIIQWMKDRVQEVGAKGGVFGVSGGVDSALVLALAKRAWGDNCMGLVLPCHSLPEDVEDALMLLDLFKCDHKLIDLTGPYDAMVETLKGLGEPNGLALANLKPRLRMMTLYYQAALSNYLVVGTGNRDEYYIGYFTKYGDGGCDIAPLARLTKGEVREMARFLGVPQKIVDRVPSAGLWRGQTDEGEIGLTYRELDDYLLGKEVSPEAKALIEKKHRQTEHKRRTPPIPDEI
ncbi:MAG TPA: NAD(+) synthase [Firmicutes bacterium]|nr:NAD(+) synthase [Candidatus Fermentithermobacillaceae bacterium]